MNKKIVYGIAIIVSCLSTYQMHGSHQKNVGPTLLRRGVNPNRTDNMIQDYRNLPSAQHRYQVLSLVAQNVLDISNANKQARALDDLLLLSSLHTKNYQLSILQPLYRQATNSCCSLAICNLIENRIQALESSEQN